MSQRRCSWAHIAVWHATLNAFGFAFSFSMVTGADKDRLGTLLGLAYAMVALLTLVPALLRCRRDDQDPGLVPRIVQAGTLCLGHDESENHERGRRAARLQTHSAIDWCRLMLAG